MRAWTPLLLLLPLSCDPVGEDSGAVVPTGTPSVEVSPRELTFELTDGTAEIQTFTVANYGTAELTLYGLDLGGSDADRFTVLDDPSQLTLAPRDSVVFEVVVDPDDDGLQAELMVRTSDPDRPEIELDLVQPTPTDQSGGEVAQDQLIDVFILLDTAYSYSCYHPDLERFIEDLTNEIFDHFEDVSVGFGTYDDYVGVGSGWANTGGHPYEMRHQISNDRDSLQAAARGLAMDYGGDGPGSAYEALFQAAWGAGFDLDCDGVFDPSTDIAPFVSERDDAFGGAADGVHDGSVQGTGDRPGVGWREGATRIVILGADNSIRDPDLGHPMPEGTCFEPADKALAVEAFTTSDTRFLGVNVYEWQDGDPELQIQLENFARATDSWIDQDGDGIEEEPAVLYGSWNWPSIVEVLEAIEDLAVVE